MMNKKLSAKPHIPLLAYQTFLLSLFQSILLEYQGIEAEAFTIQMTAVVLFQTSILFGELLCYFFINTYIYVHNNKMLQTSIISNEAYRNRQRSHAFSVTGQMYHFFAELLFITLANIALHTRDQKQAYNMYEIVLVFKAMSFCLMTFVQFLTSAEIRNDFIAFFKIN